MWVAFAHFDEAPSDALRHGARRPVRRGEAAGRRVRAAARALRPRGRRGLRPDRGVTDRHLLGRPAAAVRLRRPGARGDRAARRRRRRRATRWSATPGRSGCAARTSSPATSTTPKPRRGCSPTTAGCAPATSPWSTRTAACTSSTGPRTSIIVSGFNVFPAEVEDVLAAHPDVADVGVIGVPHPHTGEAVKAFVVLEPGATLDEDAAHRLRPRPPRPVQVPEQGPVRRRAAPLRHRQARPPRARSRSVTPLGRRRARGGGRTLARFFVNERTSRLG